MKPRISVAAWIGLFMLAFLAEGCRTMSHKPMGGIELGKEQVQAGLPQNRPSHVYVADFQLGSENFHADEGARGILPGLLHRRLEGFGQGLPTPLGSGDPAQAARKIVDEMAEAITKGLQEKGIAASRLDADQYPQPKEGWLINGVFTEVDEGNRIKRAVMGFGKGATQMEIQVSISDLQSANPKSPFVIFGTLKDPNKMPGAIVSKNPYVAAAKFVLEKNATTKDVKNSAQQIVDELMKFWNQGKQANFH